MAFAKSMHQPPDRTEPRRMTRLRRLRAAFGELRREWWPSLANARDRSALAAVFGAVVLIGAPVAQSISARCNECPASCPMHQPRETAKQRPSCHNDGSMSAGHAEHGKSHESSPLGPRLTRPPCGHNGAVPGVAIGPMILPPLSGLAIAPIVRSAPDVLQLHRANLADAPETPPPILSV